MFWQALRLVERSTIFSKIFRWLALALSIAVLATGLYDWIRQGANLSESLRLLRHFITALILIYYYISPYLARWMSVSKLFRRNSTRVMQGVVNLEGIRIGSENNSSLTYEWKDFFRKARKEDLLVLVTVRGSLALFHRSFFQSEADWQRFLQLVDGRVVEPK